MTDHIKIILLDSGYNKYFEAEADADKPKKIIELLFLVKSKGVSVPLNDDSKDFEWW